MQKSGYNENGEIVWRNIKGEDGIQNYQFEYEYDENNNWINKIVSFGLLGINEPIFIYERKFVYYQK